MYISMQFNLELLPIKQIIVKLAYDNLIAFKHFENKHSQAREALANVYTHPMQLRAAPNNI